METNIVHIIRSKLIDGNGSAQIKMLNGKILNFWLSENADGIKNSGYKLLNCKWEDFTDIVKKAVSLGGMMYYGSAAARTAGKKLGKGVPINSLDGFIAHEIFHTPIGASVTMRAPYYAAILDWADIVKNHKGMKGQGTGAFIKVNPEFMNEI